MTPVYSEFHTNHATPQQLFRELRSLLGDDAQFKVEMRHNVYNIETDQDLDLDALYKRCQGRRRRVPRTSATTDLQPTSQQSVDLVSKLSEETL